MTPAARAQTAIEILDAVDSGMAAERALTRWSRAARHAGSSDRAAVRDLVFGVLRRWWSTAALGGATSGRARMLGWLRQEGTDPAGIFTGQRHAPAGLSGAEMRGGTIPDGATALDCPRWLEAELARGLGTEFAPVMEALRHRAPVHLRVNTARADPVKAAAALAAEGIATRPGPLSPTALEVTANPRRVQQSRAFRDGWVELQDAASQFVADQVPAAARVLDLCAGGGGKALAVAARTGAQVVAHDADVARMRDLPARAGRAGTAIACRDGDALDRERPFDVVLVDAPCSGSGAWRRSPEGKLRLTPSRLDALTRQQDAILDRAATLTPPGGRIVYATCSLLARENAERVTAFLDRHTGWTRGKEYRLTPLDGGDGFYVAQLSASAHRSS